MLINVILIDEMPEIKLKVNTLSPLFLLLHVFKIPGEVYVISFYFKGAFKAGISRLPEFNENWGNLKLPVISQTY